MTVRVGYRTIYMLCVCDGSRNIYLVMYIFGPISSVDWHQVLTRRVDLIFLSHSYCVFYKASLLSTKSISLIKNDTVEKGWIHHAKGFPFLGEIKAKGKL